ncbi:hypothetical protein QBC44DRAFT_252428, partial [Cladorrhinum sp. PSN332]
DPKHRVYNYGPLSHPLAHPQYRKLTQEEINVITSALDEPIIRAREINTIVKKQVDRSVLIRKDIYNA